MTDIIMSAIMLIFMDKILLLAGASSDTCEYTETYLTIIVMSGPFVLISNCYSNVIRAEGQSVRAIMGQLLSNLLNVLLDPIMILLLGWNAAGASVATVIGNVFGACYYLHFFISRKSTLCMWLGQGVQPLLGYCFGAGLRDRFKDVLRFALIFALCLGRP